MVCGHCIASSSVYLIHLEHLDLHAMYINTKSSSDLALNTTHLG